MSLSPNDPGLTMSSADIPTLIAAYETSIRDFRDIAAELTAEQCNTASPCPGWTLGDLVAHIGALEHTMSGAPATDYEPDWASLAHVRDDEFSRMTEVGVDERRSRSQADVQSELDELIETRIEQLVNGPQSADAMTTGPVGSSVPLERLLRMRTFDLWVHEQDIRETIQQPGHMSSVGAQVSANTLVGSLSYVWGKRVAAPAGSALEVCVTGAIPFTRTVAVGDDGRAGFVPSTTTPTTRVQTDWRTYHLISTGRIDPMSALGDITIEGDRALGLRFIANANIAP